MSNTNQDTQRKEIINSMVQTFTMKIATIPRIGKTIQPNSFPTKATEQPNRLKDTQFLLEHKFYDKEFPKTWESIYGFCGGDLINDGLRAQLNWLKPTYIFKTEKYDIFTGNEVVSDIEQGKLSDCYFLSAAASIAENPECIKRLIYPLTPNKEGCYSVFLNVFGMWEEVVIDHRLPVNKFTKKPIFNASDRVVLWSMLLEKAYAKIHGGYANIAWGISRYSFTDLTGAPAENFFVDVKNQKQIDERFEMLKEAVSKKWPMTTLSKNLSGDGRDDLGALGIVSNHYYSLTDARILHAGSKTFKLVKLRNPWGKGEWRGAWNDNDKVWSQKLQDIMGHQVKEDGEFYMDYDDYNKYFKSFQICYFYENYFSSAFRMTMQNGQDYWFKFKINKPGLWYFMQHQIVNKMYHPDKHYKYSNISFSIVRIGKNDLAHNVKTFNSKDKQGFTQADCPVGTYYIQIRTYWESFANQLTFSAYGPEQIAIKRVSFNNLRPQWVSSIMYERALAPNPKYKDGKNGWIELGKPGIRMKFETCEDNFGYWLVENKNNDQTASLEINLTDHQNLYMLAPFIGNYNPKFQVPSGATSHVAFQFVKPYTLKQKFFVSFQQDRTVISQEFKQTASLHKRKYNNKSADINLYIACDNEVYTLAYENKTTNLILDEWISFELSGCHIEGENGSGVHVYLLPGKSRIVRVQKNNIEDQVDLKHRNSNVNKTIEFDRTKFENFEYQNPEASDIDTLVYAFCNTHILKERFGCVWPPTILTIMINVLNQKTLEAMEKSRKNTKLT